jgi:carboxyl-terminal processing protease
MNPFSALTAVLAAAVVALAAGLWLGGHPNSLPDGLRDVFVDDEQALHSEVREAILDNFYREVPGERLDRASLTGMVRSLDDPFSHYLPPADFTALQRRLQGQFEGVGMGVDQDKRGLLVVHVFDDSPAQRAGIHKGDVITEVNGESIAGESSDVSTAKIRGRPGTKVRLTVLTPRPERTRELTLERARIQVPIVDSELRGAGAQRVGVVRLAEFSNGSHGKLREEIERVRKRGAKGLVLDLRGNGGGVLDEAVLVGSIFIEDGLVVSTRGRTRDERRFNALGDAIDAKLPVVVLVDRGSASASEIVTGALRDRHRATVVGERTYGKGVFQEVKRLSNGGALDITVGSYYLPRGENITKKGIQPQVRARDNPRTRRDEAMPVALEALRDRIR